MNTGNLQSSGGREIILPPSHNVFDMNQVAEMVAFKESDVELSNYITKEEDVSNERHLQS